MVSALNIILVGWRWGCMELTRNDYITFESEGWQRQAVHGEKKRATPSRGSFE
jgi:hypothetical protein